MIFICLVLFLLILFPILEYSRSRILHVCLILIYAFVFSLRSDSVPDTVAYKEMYLGYYGSDTIESGYLWLCSVFREWGFSFREFLFIWIFACLILWRYCTVRITKSNDLFVALMLFMSYMGIYNYGIILRAATALTIIFIALTYYLNSNSKYRILVYWTLCWGAIQFHQTSIVFFVMPFVCNHVYSSKLLYSAIVCSMLLTFSSGIFINLRELLSDAFERVNTFGYLTRFNSYLDRSEDIQTFSFSLTQLKFCLFAAFFVYGRNYLWKDGRVVDGFNFFLNLYIVGVLLYALFSYMIAGVRIAYMALFFEFILEAIIIFHLPRQSLKVAVFVVAVLVNYTLLFAHVPKLINYI